jgi:hypothetical protein
MTRRTRPRLGIRLIAVTLAVTLPELASSADPALPWSKMIWESGTLGGETVKHLALDVAITLEGSKGPATMQLDTGAVNWVYEVPYRQLNRNDPRDSSVNPEAFTLSGIMGDRPFDKERFYLRKNFGEPIEAGKASEIGTVGATFFEQRILVLDFVAQQLAILDKGQDLPAAIASRAGFTAIEYRHGKLFIAVTLNGIEERNVFFDSGSSSFSLLTSRRHWLEWTGAKPEDPANRQMPGNSWDQKAMFVGAPLKGDMCVATTCVPRPLAYFESTGIQNLDFDRASYTISGLFGNAPFDGRYTVIVDLPHNRFGLIEGSLANPTAHR